MTTDVGRFQANQRVDLADFTFVVDESMRSQSRHWADQFMRDPARDGPSWILSGFDITYVAYQLTVTRGRAILGHREVGDIFYGSLATEGAVERVVDVTTFSPNTYNIYVRFELIDGESSSRAFWDPAGDGAEFAQTIATRRLADWSVRVELTSPGMEWLKIGEVVVGGGGITGVTEQRDFYFEGNEDQSYASQWSTDGGGSANDRDADRATYGVKSLHTFTAAMRQCIEDIRGRGLRRWWERSIGGINIGFDTNPVEGRLAIGDASFYLDLTGIDPQIIFDTNVHIDRFWFDRSENGLYLYINSELCFYANSEGVRAQGLSIHPSCALTTNENELRVGDLNFKLQYFNSNNVYIWFNIQTYFHCDRAADTLLFRMDSVNTWLAEKTGTRTIALAISSDLSLSASLANTILIGDAQFYLQSTVVTGDPHINLDTNDYLVYDRSTGWLEYYINNTRRHAWLSSKGYIQGTALDVTVGLQQPGEYTYAQNTGMRCMHGPSNTGGATVNEVKALHTNLLRTNQHTDQSLVGASIYQVFSVLMNIGQATNKVFRVVMWGTVEETAYTSGSGSFVPDILIRAGIAGTVHSLTGKGWKVGAGSGTSHENRDHWRVEGIIHITGATATEYPHTNLIQHYYDQSNHLTYIKNSSTLAPMDLAANGLQIIGQVSNVINVSHEFDICGAFIEEMGGETN